MFFQLGTVVGGNNVTITYLTLNQRLTPPIPMTPDGGVSISIRRPDGVVVVTDAPMSTVKVGYYFYDYQSVTGDMEGVWMARAKTLHLSKENLSDWEPVFNLQSPA